MPTVLPRHFLRPLRRLITVEGNMFDVANHAIDAWLQFKMVEEATSFVCLTGFLWGLIGLGFAILKFARGRD